MDPPLKENFLFTDSIKATIISWSFDHSSSISVRTVQPTTSLLPGQTHLLRERNDPLRPPVSDHRWRRNGDESNHGRCDIPGSLWIRRPESVARPPFPMPYRKLHMGIRNHLFGHLQRLGEHNFSCSQQMSRCSQRSSLRTMYFLIAKWNQ
jgi:hypothetical protein